LYYMYDNIIIKQNMSLSGSTNTTSGTSSRLSSSGLLQGVIIT